MKRSKYLGMKSGDWTCTHVGVASVMPAFCKTKKVDGKRTRSLRPGHQSYYYIWQRLTSDGIAQKMIRLSAAQARAVLNGRKTVEEYSQEKEALRSQEFIHMVSYSFCD